MAAFNGIYVKTMELMAFEDGRVAELGHYKDGDKEYGDKIYIVSSYTTKKGEEKTNVKTTGLTIKDFAEMVNNIDLSQFDTKTVVNFD